MSGRKPEAVLSVAGLDASGRAGLTADVRAITTLGLEAAVACTAVTVQTEAGLVASHPVPPEIVAAQVEAAFGTCTIRAVKTGMLVDAETVRAVAGVLGRTREGGADFRLVVDPVMAATAGGRLLTEEGVAAVVSDLLPLADVVTPNLDEAARLSGTPVAGTAQMKLAAQKIHALGVGRVVVTGGHLPEAVTDVIYDGETFQELPGQRVSGAGHGSGCAYAASLAAYLAKGTAFHKAAAGAKQMARLWIEGTL